MEVLYGDSRQKQTVGKDVASMNGLSQKTSFNIRKHTDESPKYVTKMNGQTKAPTLPFQTQTGMSGSDDSSSTNGSPSSCTVSTNSDSLKNGHSANEMLTNCLETDQTNLSSVGGNDRRKSGEINLNRAEKADAPANIDNSKDAVASSIDVKTDCANIGDYVESALISTNASLLSPTSQKSVGDANSSYCSPRLSSFQSFSTLNQDTRETNFELKPDFVTLDYIKSAVVNDRRLKTDANETNSCSSSLSSSFMSSIESEDGSINSDVVENLRNKIAAASAKHKLKSTDIHEQGETEKYEQDPLHYSKPDNKNGNTEQSLVFNRISTEDFPPPPALQERCNECGGITSEFNLKDSTVNVGTHDSFGQCKCSTNSETDEVEELDLSNCNLKTVPDYVHEYASSLLKLSLESNAIVDLPKELFECRRLQELLVGDNDIAKLPSSLGGLTDLQHLDISKNVIEDIPDCMPCLKKLRVLDASVNPIEILSESFTQLINLQKLYMNDCFFDYLPASFGRMSELRVLELRDNQLQILPKSIRRLSNINRLDLGGNVLQDWPEVISKLTNLSELWLDGNELNKISSEIGQLDQLTYLDLSKNMLQSIPNQIGSLKLLTDLLLAENNITSLPESIGFLRCLTALSIEHNEIEKLPDSIGKLTNLEELDASHNKLKELSPSVGKLSKLRMLLLDDNLLVELPHELGSCSSLSVLQLSQNRIEALPDSFGNLESLRVLNISQNRVHHLPITLRNLTQLEALWVSPNQSKPSVPVHVELDPDSQCQILTNLLFPQEENGLSRASKVLGSVEDDSDDEKFAVDAADDDDLEAYSRRERGKTQVVFDLNSTTYSEATDFYKDSEFFDYTSNDDEADLKRLRKDSKGNISSTSEDPTKNTTPNDSVLDEFAIEIPAKQESTGLVVSLDVGATKSSKQLADVSVKSVMDDDTGDDVDSALPLNVAKYENRKDSNSSQSVNNIDRERSLDLFNSSPAYKNIYGERSNKLPDQNSSAALDSKPRNFIELFAARQSSQNSVSDVSDANDKTIIHVKQDAETTEKETVKPQVSAKPSKLNVQEFHASNETSHNKSPTNEANSVDFVSLQEAEKGQDTVASRSSNGDISSVEKKQVGKSLARSNAFDIKATNAMSTNARRYSSEQLTVIPESVSNALQFIDSETGSTSVQNKAALIPESNLSNLVSEKPFNNFPATDNSAEEMVNNKKEERPSPVNEVPSSSGESRFKVSWKPTSSVVTSAPLKQNQFSPQTSLTSDVKMSSKVSQVTKDGSTNKEVDTTTQGLSSNLSTLPKSSAPPPPPRKSSVSLNIKKFEKRFEQSVPSPGSKNSGSPIKYSPQKPAINKAKPTIEKVSKSKPMAIATILPSAKTPAQPDLKAIQMNSDKSDFEDAMIANDVLKSLDLYTKGREIQKLNNTNDYDIKRIENSDSTKVPVSSKPDVRSSESSEKRSSHTRKSKFDEALAATKHKHFREKLEKMMHLQQQQTSVGDSLRRLSRGSTSSISSIPRITSPIPQHHNFASDRMKTNNEERNRFNSYRSTGSKEKNQNVHQPSPQKPIASSDSTFIKRGSTLRSSLRSSSRTPSEQKPDSDISTSKSSLEEQLGQLLLDGSSSSSSNHRGFVPYLPDEFCRSTSTRSIKRSSSSSKDKQQSPADLNNARKPTRPEDWRNQLLDYLDKKKKEKTVTPMKTAQNSPRTQQHFIPQQSGFYSQNASDKPVKAAKHQIPSPIEKKTSFPPTNAPKKQTKTASHNSNIPPLTPPRPEGQATKEQLSNPNDVFANFSRNNYQRSSGRRSSSKYQRTRTPGPEMMSSEPRVKDLAVRPKSAMDRPISSHRDDLYTSNREQDELPPKDPVYKNQPSFTSAPPTYEDHIIRQMTIGSYNEDRQTYVNLEQLHSRLRASMRKKEPPSTANQTPHGSHVTPVANKPRDLAMQSSSTRDHFVNKQENKSRSHDSRANLFNHPPVNHEPRAKYTQHHPHKTPPHPSSGYYVEQATYQPHPHQPVYDEMSRYQPHQTQNDHPNKYVGRLPSNRPSKPAPYLHQPVEVDSRVVKNHNPIYQDLYYLEDPQNYRHHPSFLPPEKNLQNNSHHYSNPYQAEYIDNEESTVSAFRPYQHQPTNHTRQNQVRRPSHTPHHPSIPVQYKDEQNYYPKAPVYDSRLSYQPLNHLDYQHHPDNYQPYTVEEHLHGYNQELYGRGLNITPPDNPTHSYGDFGLELVTVTVKKDPNFGFHIMGGVGAGGNPFRPDDEGVFITYVARGGPADGLVKPGDKILLVNGSDFVGISHTRAVDLLKNAGQAAVLVVERVVGRPV